MQSQKPTRSVRISLTKRFGRGINRIEFWCAIFVACSCVLTRSVGDELVQDPSAPQTPVPVDTDLEPTEPQPVQAISKDKTGNEWVVAPIPKRSPNQGWGLNLVAQYIFNPKKSESTSPPSVIAIGAMYTEEESRGIFAAYKGHWDSDAWRPTIGGGSMKLNDRFYGVGNESNNDLSIPIEEDFTFGFVQILRRVRPNLYLGARVSRFNMEVTTRFEEDLQLPPLELEINSTTFGPMIQWDTRDNQFFPTTGYLATATAMFASGDRDYETYKAEWNGYIGLSDRQVIAYRAATQMTRGDAPFYAVASFGQQNDLRGYRKGKYSDNDLLAVQAEYRHKFSESWGGVLFAGVGEVAPSLSELNGSDMLSSVGIGIRFKLAKKNPVNFRADWAYGEDGGYFYLGIGEAF